jgi:hypothetical protein
MVRITLLLLLLSVTLASNMLFAQESSKIIPVTNNATDNIDFPYYGEWGWHKVHMRPLKRFLIKSPLTPSRKIDVCFKCHDKKNEFRICDPHTQLNEKGDIIREKCLYCHLEKPDEKSATFEIHRKEVKFIRNLETLCLGCHSSQYHRAHPVNANHVLKPSAEMLSMMKKTEEEFDIVLPLNYDGKIMCATCHNPHERGVIPNEREAAGGASEKFRIRLPGQTEKALATGESEEYITRLTSSAGKICLACHKDKEELEK